MKCKQYRNRLEEWLDGELNADESTVMELHGRTCAECARFLAARRALGEVLKTGLQEWTAGLHFQPRLQPLPAKPRRLRLVPAWGMAVAAAVVAALTFLYPPWMAPRRERVPPPLPTMVVTISGSQDAMNAAFISGRIAGRDYMIQLQITNARIDEGA